MPFDPAPLLLTFKLAAVTTLILLLVGVPIAYGLAFHRFRLKSVCETVVAMPLVLPPTVLGFYLLLLLGQNNPLSRLLADSFNLRLVFTFTGLVLASVIYSLPFMVHPLQTGFQGVPVVLAEASYTLGKSRLVTLFRVILPNMKPAILTGLVLSFAHTVGEFGVVLMIGGNIPGRTRVASIAIYDEVQALNFQAAHMHAFILLAISFVTLLTVYTVNRRYFR